MGSAESSPPGASQRPAVLGLFQPRRLDPCLQKHPAMESTSEIPPAPVLLNDPAAGLLLWEGPSALRAGPATCVVRRRPGGGRAEHSHGCRSPSSPPRQEIPRGCGNLRRGPLRPTGERREVVTGSACREAAGGDTEIAFLSSQPLWMPHCCSRETGEGPGEAPELRRVQVQPGLRPSAKVPDASAS